MVPLLELFFVCMFVCRFLQFCRFILQLCFPHSVFCRYVGKALLRDYGICLGNFTLLCIILILLILNMTYLLNPFDTWMLCSNVIVCNSVFKTAIFTFFFFFFFSGKYFILPVHLMCSGSGRAIPLTHLTIYLYSTV